MRRFSATVVLVFRLVDGRGASIAVDATTVAEWRDGHGFDRMRQGTEI